jgi:hypothetical protein
MTFPAFFDRAPTITLRDPLAEFLGTATDGLITYTYADAVKLTGHSCPTTAGAYLATRAGLRFIYGDATPERGCIRVEFRDPQEHGVIGVIASVVRLVTGAAGADGFKGIGGRFDRRGLLAFASRIPSEVRFTRTDTGAGVDVGLQLALVPADPAMSPLLQRCARGEANSDAAEFGRLWQDRVRRILVDHADDVRLIPMQAVPAP